MKTLCAAWCPDLWKRVMTNHRHTMLASVGLVSGWVFVLPSMLQWVSLFIFYMPGGRQQKVTRRRRGLAAAFPPHFWADCCQHAGVNANMYAAQPCALCISSAIFECLEHKTWSEAIHTCRRAGGSDRLRNYVGKIQFHVCFGVGNCHNMII